MFIYLDVLDILACKIFFEAAACEHLAAGEWGPVPWPGIKPQAPCFRRQSVSHWATREVPALQ